MNGNKQTFPKKITDPFIYTFSVSEEKLYAIALSARCRSGKQIGVRGGEDLRVEIDDLKLREVPAVARPQYKDIPPAWNGTKLKGLKKTAVFLLVLKRGEHQIKFIPSRGAVIETEPDIKPITDTVNIEFSPEEQAEDGDRRPWYTFTLINLPLKSFSVDATAKWRFMDSDDLKLIVNQNIKKNRFSILHRNWLWSGSIFRKLFKKERDKKSFDENLDRGIHYIELWADRMSVLHQAVFDLGPVKTKRMPTVDDPEWTGDFADDSEQMLLARLIFGEAENQSREAKIAVGFTVINRVKKQKTNWGLTFKEVILKESQYDAFWNPRRREKVRNPLAEAGPSTERAWRESYEVAEQVLDNTIEDPTGGSTSFHSFTNPEDFPFWATEENFRVKIDDLWFYELEG